MRYSKEDKQRLSASILSAMADNSVSGACRACDVNLGTFMGWLREDDQLANDYAQARTLFPEKLANEILAIADEEVGTTDNGGSDNGAVQRNRVRIDARKWLLSKLAPKKYGERLAIAADEESPLKITHIVRTIVDTTGDDQPKAIEDDGQ